MKIMALFEPFCDLVLLMRNFVGLSYLFHRSLATGSISKPRAPMLARYGRQKEQGPTGESREEREGGSVGDKEEMKSFLTTGAAIANCNRL